MSLAVLFSIVTLPVEFDASSRAMKQITALNIVNEKNINMLKGSFSAMTYVVLRHCRTSKNYTNR